jgi:hypothetical protein
MSDRTTMSSTRRSTRELAERTSNGTRVRLLWRQGTRHLWVEVREPATDLALAIPIAPERALDAFHHPYAYAGAHSPRRSSEPLSASDRQLRVARKESREQ